MSTVEEVVARLDAIDGADPEGAHSRADALLLSHVDPRIRAAYNRVASRCSWWACA